MPDRPPSRCRLLPTALTRLQHQQRQVVVRRPFPELVHEPPDAFGDQLRASSPAQPTSAVARPSSSSNMRGPAAPLGDPVGHTQQRVAGPQLEGLGCVLGVLDRPRAASAARPPPVPRRRGRSSSGSGCPARGEGAADAARRRGRARRRGGRGSGSAGRPGSTGRPPAATRARAARPPPPSRRRGASWLRPVEHVGDAVPLAGEQPQPGPGEADDDRRLGALALDVADREAPAAAGPPGRGRRSRRWAPPLSHGS